MTHEAIRQALQAKIEDLKWGGSSMGGVLARFATHADPTLLEAYQQQLLLSSGAPEALARRPDHSPQALAGGTPGSLGHAVRAAVTTRASAAPSAPFRDADAAYLFQLVHEWRDVWRVVLGYDDDPLDEWSLQAFTAAQHNSIEGFLWIAVLFARVGFITPEAAIAVHDAVADGWLRGKTAPRFLGVEWAPLWTVPLAEVRARLKVPERGPVDGVARAHARTLLAQPGRLPSALPALFWDMASSQVDPATITPRIALFGSTYDDQLKEACARAILLHQGQDEIARQPWPPRVQIESLCHYREGTLGHAFYHLITDNGFDPEVLDPESVTGFHPGLDATNRRILQTHEVWHLVAGYSTSPLHETAISSFQLAQFGHNYSAIFLATVTMLLTLNAPAFADLALQVMAEGWRHGRATRPMMLIEWPQLWDKSIEAIRREYGIAPFESVVPDIEG